MPYLRSILLSLLSITLLAGCATNSETPSSRTTLVFGSALPLFDRTLDPSRFSSERCSLFGDTPTAACNASRRDAAVMNEHLVSWIRLQESAFAAAPGESRSRRPKLCVALSGGGARAAAFSLGVLQSLAESHRSDLEATELFSGVSGSSYTLGWLYKQLGTHPQHTIAEILSDVELNATLAKRVDERWGTAPVYAGVVTGVAIGRPTEGLLHFLDRVADPREPYGPAQSFARDGYARSIAEVFLDSDERFSIGDVSRLLIERARRSEPLPVPVLGATAGWGELRCNHRENIDSVAFEIGPARIGSDDKGFTYPQLMKRSDLATLVAVSASAPDNPCSVALGAATLITGRFGAMVDSFPGIRTLVMSGKDVAREENSVVLGDGGFSENLGILAPIRRLCERVLVVDGEEDPHMDFSALVKVTVALRNSYGFPLTVDALGGAPHISHALCTGPREAQNCYRASKSALVAFTAQVADIPFAAQGVGDAGVNVKITYLKLALDRSRPELYPQPLDKYVRSLNARCERRSDLDCSFPHDPTVRQRFTTDKWNAYVSLGRNLAEKCVDSGFALREECASAAVPSIRHLR